MTEDKPNSKKSNATGEDKLVREARRGSAGKCRGSPAKKVTREESGTSDEKKARQENRAEDKILAKEAREVAEAKTRREVPTAKDERGPRKDSRAQSEFIVFKI